MSDYLLPRLLAHTASALAGAPVGGVFSIQITVVDRFDSGPFRIADTVGIKGAPDILGPYRVDLFCGVSRRLVRSTVSDTAGNYVFTNIRQGPWIVIAYDHTGTYNAVIADRIEATLP